MPAIAAHYGYNTCIPDYEGQPTCPFQVAALIANTELLLLAHVAATPNSPIYVGPLYACPWDVTCEIFGINVTGRFCEAALAWVRR